MYFVERFRRSASSGAVHALRRDRTVSTRVVFGASVMEGKYPGTRLPPEYLLWKKIYPDIAEDVTGANRERSGIPAHIRRELV